MSKVKINEMTKQLSDATQSVLAQVRAQQQQWRQKAQLARRAEQVRNEQARLEAEQERALELDASPEAPRDAALAMPAQTQGDAVAAQRIDTPDAADALVVAENAQARSSQSEPDVQPAQEPAGVQESVQAEEKKQTQAPAAKAAEAAPQAAQPDAARPAAPAEVQRPQQRAQAPERPVAQQRPVARGGMQFDSNANRPFGRPPAPGQAIQGADFSRTRTFNGPRAQGGARPAQAGARSFDNNRPPRQGGIGTPRTGGYQAGNRTGGYQGGQRSGYQAGGARPGGYQGGNRTGGYQGAQRPGGFGGAGRPAGGRSAGQGGGFATLLPVAEKERASNYDPNRSMYARKSEQEKRTPNRRALQKRAIPEINLSGDDTPRGSRRPRRKPKQQMQHVIEPIKIDKAVIATEMISVKDLSEKLGKPAGEIIKRLFMLGIMATINNEIDFDTAQLVASEFDIELELKLEKTYEDVMMDDAQEEDDEANLVTRPPVVTIMGHVDHGKTSILDAIRKTRVTDQEAGGITQHIGAYTVVLRKRPITFLDTPGHEAFTAMRARGAQVTDITILVVAADDGIMPQTVEAINHAKAAGVPMIVAINKIDKAGANVERVKQELTEHSLVPEEWGGDTVVVPVSAHTGEGLEQLLEMILLVADVQELKANPNRRASGTIVEARLDKGRGPVATVLVQNGTLHVGDTIVAGTAYGRVRAMQNDRGARVNSAGPSQPVEVIGFSEVPEAGDTLHAVEEDRLSRQVAEERRDRQKAEQIKAMAKVSLDDLFSQIEEGNIKDLNIIVKADVQGSAEAVRASLEKISNEEVRVRVIHAAVGAISESDVNLASASNAIIVGFNVRPQPSARDAAEREKVDIRLYRVIYNAIEDIEQAMKGMLAPKFQEIILGHAEVRQVFRVSHVGSIAGCYVTDGKITRSATVRILRDNIVVHECKIDSLKRFKDDAREVAAGYECGIGLENYNDIKEGDQFEAFVQEEVAAE
nr:translation initiation factor IF-2 [Maliibacterium massiliense]